MASTKMLLRALRPAVSSAFARPLSTSVRLSSDTKADNHSLNERDHRQQETAPDFRKRQQERPLNPHMTNTNSTISNEMPSVGADAPPPELITAVDPNYTPKDSVPENTERMTGGTQQGGPDAGPNADLGVGEMEGASFKVEPIRRTGEDANTMRARLLCPFHILYF